MAITNTADKDLLDDNTLFETDEKYIKRRAFEFMRAFINNTPKDSKMARFIAAYFERESRIYPRLHVSFPETKRVHNELKRAAENQRRPLQERINTITHQINEMELDLHEAHGLHEMAKKKKEKAKHKKAGKKISEKLRELEFERDKIQIMINKIPVPDKFEGQYDLPDNDYTIDITDTDWSYIDEMFQKDIERLSDEKPPFYLTNLMAFCDYLKLAGDEKEFITFLLCVQDSEMLNRFTNDVSLKKAEGYKNTLNKMLSLSKSKMEFLLSDESPLVQNGLIVREDGPDLPGVSLKLIEILSEPGIDIEGIRNKLIGTPVTTELDWDKDFAHLGEKGQELLKLFEGAMAKKKNGESVQGINFLLYGVQDTGKTEAVKAICKKLGVDLYSVGEKQKSGGKEPSRTDRISQALMAQALLADTPNAVILFDEMEDALPQGGGGNDLISMMTGKKPDEGEKTLGASKVYLNRILENNKTISFWTANDPEKFHAAVRRRICFPVPFNIPPVSAREKLWLSISEKFNIEIPQEERAKLAREFRAPPGMIATALRNTGLTGDIKSIRRSITASSALVFGSAHALEIKDDLPDYYDPTLLNPIVDNSNLSIEELNDDLIHTENKDFSLLLYGPPGTGKSAYVRYLAKQLDMEVLFKRASDILGMYVGQNEQNIAKAFSEAIDGNMFLIIDEADTFLRDRNSAQRGWEVSMVNEMLTWMERHPIPFAMTTNLVDNLDQASKRRFDLKIKYDYLNGEQAARAFNLFFKMEAPQGIFSTTQLTPGDFANVAQQTKFKRHKPDANKLLELLEAEVAMKNDDGLGGLKHPPGFGIPKRQDLKLKPTS